MGCGASTPAEPPAPTKPEKHAETTAAPSRPNETASGAAEPAPPSAASSSATPPGNVSAAPAAPVSDVPAVGALKPAPSDRLTDAESALLEWSDEWYRCSRLIAACKSPSLFESMPETRSDLAETEHAEFLHEFEKVKTDRFGERSPLSSHRVERMPAPLHVGPGRAGLTTWLTG